MTFDTSHYNAPGVYTQGVPGPQIGVNSTAPTALALFGDTIGYRTDTQTLVVPADSGGNAQPTTILRQQGVNESSVVVRDLITGATYIASTDYTIQAITGPSGVTQGFDSTYTITRVIGGNLAAGTQIQASFNYTDTTYFTPTSFFTFNDVQNAYGAPMDSNGNIISELTLGSYFAFQNGASQIIACAVDPTATPPTVQNYTDALNKFQVVDSIAIIVPCTGNQSLFTAVKTHVDSESINSHERRAILGMDGSITSVASATRITNAQSIDDTRVAMVSPATVTYFNPNTNATQILGGQFLACAVAGINAVQQPAIPLTRKTITGFVNIAESEAEPQKDQEAQAGLMVCENTNQGTMRIRHGVTTAPGTLITREWTITGQSDAMVYQLRAFLDGDGLIGGVINALTMPNILASASAALADLVQNGVILGYSGLAVSQLVNSPDVVEITFAWQPSIPLNYILVSYSIDTTTGNISLASTSNL